VILALNFGRYCVRALLASSLLGMAVLSGCGGSSSDPTPPAGGSSASCTSTSAAPAGLTASASSASAVTLSWTAATAPTNCSISSYNVYTSTTSGFTPSANNLLASGVTGPSYSDVGLSASTTYYYVVEALDAAGASVASNPANARTSSATTTPTACTTVAPAPTGVKAAAASASAITLSWTAATAPANCSIGSYNVYSSATICFTPSSGNLLAAGITGTTYSNTGLAAAATEYYVVQALDAAGMSPASNQASATTSAASTTAPAQFLGATFGFNYENDMVGPDDNAGTGAQAILNVPLYNPDPNNTPASWDTWVREAGQAGLNFLCPNLRGASPIAAWSPAGMAPILTALNNSGFASQIKICAFDDNASSWQAQLA
jgi:hypothetical protein